MSIYIEEKGRSGGGPQNYSFNKDLKFSLNVLPNIIKDKMIFEIVIPEKQRINLSIYDASGREVFEVLDKEVEPGIYKINFDKKLNKGIYFAILKGKEKKIKKFIIFKN